MNQLPRKVKPNELPLHCQGPENEPWNGHPRVFLKFKSHSEVACPYCGTVYYLDGEVTSHH